MLVILTGLNSFFSALSALISILLCHLPHFDGVTCLCWFSSTLFFSCAGKIVCAIVRRNMQTTTAIAATALAIVKVNVYASKYTSAYLSLGRTYSMRYRVLRPILPINSRNCWSFERGYGQLSGKFICSVLECGVAGTRPFSSLFALFWFSMTRYIRSSISGNGPVGTVRHLFTLFTRFVLLIHSQQKKTMRHYIIPAEFAFKSYTLGITQSQDWHYSIHLIKMKHNLKLHVAPSPLTMCMLKFNAQTKLN